MNEENFFEWEALIMGPEDTCFEFGVFPAILSFPLDYPLSPPKMRFTCEMFHPNNLAVLLQANGVAPLQDGWVSSPLHQQCIGVRTFCRMKSFIGIVLLIITPGIMKPQWMVEYVLQGDGVCLKPCDPSDVTGMSWQGTPLLRPLKGQRLTEQRRIASPCPLGCSGQCPGVSHTQGVPAPPGP
ncbi:ubiquitin-conjugating enzyme E2 G2 isoform X1 [Petaurus breviceps papuanus]|uniref:ubiquitin-conjugating enzyme E2 G2 isoform X1 n=1 Tax=Petaurus breviceps papuanus TaxID=3040969 RepID=UPI0036D98332